MGQPGKQATAGDPQITVRSFELVEAGPWDRYVRDHPDGTVFHLAAWSVAVHRAYGHRPCHLAAFAGRRLVGLLPLFFVKSIFVGPVLISVPYATYGGILADSADIRRSLLNRARELSGQLGARYLELRHREANELELPKVEHYDTFRRRLPQDPQQLIPWLPRKTRTAVRKGLKDLGPDAVTIVPENLDHVYDLYAVTLRRLGSPNYSRCFFRELARAYGDDCISLMVSDRGRPLAGVISFVFRDEIVPYFSGCLDAGMAKRANNLMYVKLMEYAVGRGLKWFDFNRTRRNNKGPYDFKRHHGFEPTPLHYQVALNTARELPNLSPGNSKFALAVKVWKKLPLWMTRPAGSVITKWIP